PKITHFRIFGFPVVFKKNKQENGNSKDVAASSLDYPRDDRVGKYTCLKAEVANHTCQKM
ncbi:MAG: hypothetical protein ACREOZ_04470, partial [Gloeomargaritales cyanobacterium]